MRTLLLILLSFPIFGQTPSDCNPDTQLLANYEWDIANLAIRQMQLTNSPSFSLVTIPQSEKNNIENGLAAILNSGLPEADSVFNFYCVHDRTSPVMTWQNLIVHVDTSVAWTTAWQNLNALTGNSFIDSLVTKYGLSISGFNNYSFGSLAEVNISQVLNIYALIDSLQQEPAISLAESNAMIGLAGKISYQEIDSMRFFNFRFEFSDCFDGCDNYREWQFSVNPDCTINYLGFTEFGFFGIQPLPLPINCNLFSAVTTSTESKVSIYPNPAAERLYIDNAENKDFKIYDLLGRNILIGRLGSDNSISLSNLKTGIYILEIEKKTYKFIVQ